MKTDKKKSLYVSIRQLIEHAERPDKADKEFPLGSCTECLACDLTGRRMIDFREIDIDYDDPDSSPGLVDSRFATFCESFCSNRVRELRNPKGREIAAALRKIYETDSDPEDLAVELVECIRSETTNAPQLIES